MHARTHASVRGQSYNTSSLNYAGEFDMTKLILYLTELLTDRVMLTTTYQLLLLRAAE